MKRMVCVLCVLMMVLGSTGCPALAVTDEEVLQAVSESAGKYEPGAPLTKDDFICYSTDSDFTRCNDDILTYLKRDGSEWVFVYPYTDLTPADERCMYYTWRGILIEDNELGDREADSTKEAVLARYGEGLSGTFDPEKDTIYRTIRKQASKEAMGKSATWLLYTCEDVGQIRFYFDADDMVNAVAWYRGIQDVVDKETTKRIQEYLNANGYDCGTPDGIAGKKTRAMLKQFQEDHGLYASGYIDDALMQYLDGDL